MAMVERKYSFLEEEVLEKRRLEVLDGAPAKARADAKRIEYVKIALCVITVFVYMLGATFVEAKIATASGEINSLKNQIAQTEAESSRLDMTIGSLSSLERIESYAMTELGMVYPGADGIYYLSAENSEVIAAALGDVPAYSASGENMPVTTADDTEDAVQVAAAEGGFWDSLNTMLGGFFSNTALAAQ